MPAIYTVSEIRAQKDAILKYFRVGENSFTPSDIDFQRYMDHRGIFNIKVIYERLAELYRDSEIDRERETHVSQLSYSLPGGSRTWLYRYYPINQQDPQS